MSRSTFGWTDEAMPQIIQHYTREAGVRNLEREIGTVCRKIATRVAEEKEVAGRDSAGADPGVSWADRASSTKSWRRARRSRVLRSVSASMASAATSCSSRRPACPARERWTITGQLGDVMKESAQAALSFVRARARDLGVDPDFLQSQRSAHPRARRARCRRTDHRPAWR